MESFPAAEHASTLATSIAGAILATWMLQFQDGGYIEILSECLCWVLVALWVEFSSRSYTKGQYFEHEGRHAAGNLSWLIAVGLATASLLRSVNDARWIVPALTPVLLAYRLDLPQKPFASPEGSRPWYISSVYGQTVIAVGSILMLVPSIQTQTTVLAALFALALLGVYVPLVKLADLKKEFSDAGMSPGFIKSVIIRTLPLLLVMVFVKAYLDPPQYITIRRVFIPGFLKASHWILLFITTRRTQWDIATTILTFSIASASVSNAAASSIFRMLGRMATALVALMQTVAMVPKSSKSSYFLVLFMICPLLPLLNTDFVAPGGHMATENLGSLGRSQHPIELLIQKSSAEFSAMLERQSSTLEAATVEYKRRYRRDPPPGFGRWFNYAKTHNSVLIDDFDVIGESLEPFWAMTPEQIRKNMNRTPDVYISQCSYKDGMFYNEDDERISRDIADLLSDVRKDIPDMEFFINSLDEPRVLFSADALVPSASSSTDKVGFFDVSMKPAWKYIAEPCSHRKMSSKRPHHEAQFAYDGLPFVEDVVASKDICQHPEYEHLHGFVMSPASLIFTNSAVPILSQAKLSTFGDILLPSPYYTNAYEQRQYKEEEEPEWEDKQNTLYWRGATTGSQSTDDSWRYSHRQRFVTLARQLENRTSTFLTEVRPGVWETYQSRDIFRQLYDVQFAAVKQCDELQCEEQQAYFQPPGVYTDAQEQYRHRFLLDLDGNSYSGRFYSHLASRSVSLKQAIFKEWHDERLFPWVHYVPVSLGLDELPELMRYLALTEAGSRQSLEIAQQGRAWAKRVLRKEDFTIFLYRLFLELARLFDDSRQAG